MDRNDPHKGVIKAEYDRRYGPDYKSGDWVPMDELIDADDIALPSNDSPNSQFDWKRNLMQYMFWKILDTIKSHVLDGKRRLISCLYHPGRYPEDMEKAAYFREQFIWPIFGSVYEFYNFLKGYQYLAEVRLQFFPTDIPSRSIDNVIGTFIEEQDDAALKLARVYKAIHSNREDIFCSFNGVMINHKSFRQRLL